MPAEIFSREFATQKKAELEKLKQPTLKKNFTKKELLVFWKEQILSFKKRNWSDEQILIGLNTVAEKDLFEMSDLKNFYKRVASDTAEKKTNVVNQEQATKVKEEEEKVIEELDENHEEKKQ